MLTRIRSGLIAVPLDSKLVDELLAGYQEIKHNYYLGGHRLLAVEGGRFCEAAYRLLQERAFTKFEPLGKQLDTGLLTKQLENIQTGVQPDSIRLHIPRALRVIYDIRSKRNAAHLVDGIDPNLQDSTLIVSVADWVLAEFVRLFHSVSPDEAHRTVNSLVTRQTPAIQDFNGFLKVLKPHLSDRDHVLLLLYQRGNMGTTFDQISQWSRPKARKKLKYTLGNLVNKSAFIHLIGDKYLITQSGQKHIESKGIAEP